MCLMVPNLVMVIDDDVNLSEWSIPFHNSVMVSEHDAFDNIRHYNDWITRIIVYRVVEVR